MDKSICTDIKFHPYWVAFIVLKGAMQATGKDNSHSYPVMNPQGIIMTALIRSAYWFNNAMNVMDVTNFWLDIRYSP